MIRMHDLAFSYGKRPLFTQLNLDIPQGSIHGLLGMNGAGKTTLLKLISGQLFPQKGISETLGYNPVKRDVAMLGQLFHLPEEFPLPRLRGDEYLKLYMPFYTKFDKPAFDRYRDAFDIDITQRLDELSLGQKKKFLLCFALASNTPLVILDEPTNGLDIPSKSQFRRIVASAMTDERTFIISTHQVRDMENLIDPIIILHDGRVVFNSRLEDVAALFTFKLERSERDSRSAVFQEKVPGGYMVVAKRADGEEETQVDLETLFNAVISAPSAFTALSGRPVQGGLA